MKSLNCLELGCRLPNPFDYYHTHVYSWPLNSFPFNLVQKALRGFRQFDGVAFGFNQRLAAEYPTCCVTRPNAT